MSEISTSSNTNDRLTIGGGEDPEESRQKAEWVLGDLFADKHKDLHPDYAAIIAFLANVEQFESVFREVDKDVAASMKKKKEEGGKNRLTTTFYELFTAYGAPFTAVQNVVLVGSSAGVFGPIVRNGIHFKDATGPGHGEYSHTVQWLVIARAVLARKLELKENVPHLYKFSAGPGTLAVKELIGQNGAPQKFTFWNVLVDCFTEEDLRLEENARENLVSSTYRSPGFFTRQVRSAGRLSDTFLAQHLTDRYDSDKRKPKEGKLDAEALRQYQKDKQKQKGTMLANLSEGVNVILPANSPEALLKALRERAELNDYKP